MQLSGRAVTKPPDFASAIAWFHGVAMMQYPLQAMPLSRMVPEDWIRLCIFWEREFTPNPGGGVEGLVPASCLI